MAIFDNAKALSEKAELENYEKLKEEISSFHETGVVNQWTLAYYHILGMEKKLREQEDKLKKYRNFFSSLKSMLPKEPPFY